MKNILMEYESESGMYRVYHPQNDSIAISRDLLIFENKINAMTKHSLMNFIDMFDDVDEEKSIAVIRSIFGEIEVLSSSKATISAITTTHQRVTSPALSSVTFSSS